MRIYVHTWILKDEVSCAPKQGPSLICHAISLAMIPHYTKEMHVHCCTCTTQVNILYHMANTLVGGHTNEWRMQVGFTQHTGWCTGVGTITQIDVF